MTFAPASSPFLARFSSVFQSRILAGQERDRECQDPDGGLILLYIPSINQHVRIRIPTHWRLAHPILSYCACTSVALNGLVLSDVLSGAESVLANGCASRVLNVLFVAVSMLMYIIVLKPVVHSISLNAPP